MKIVLLDIVNVHINRYEYILLLTFTQTRDEDILIWHYERSYKQIWRQFYLTLLMFTQTGLKTVLFDAANVHTNTYEDILIGRDVDSYIWNCP